MIAGEIYHTEPHPGVGVFGKADCLLLDGLPSAVLHLVGIPKYLLRAQQGMDFAAQYPTCTSPCQRFDAALASSSA